MSGEDESSWRLLFGIALSHGVALRSGRLSYDGWMVFLSSAQLIGTSTGVFPVLVDQLWQRQALSDGAERGGASAGAAETTSSFPRAFSLGVDSSRVSVSTRGVSRSGQRSAPSSASLPQKPTDAHSGESVGFSGFVDMMKVICVRVFQSQRCARLREEHDGGGATRDESALVALRQSAEDHVLLTESVDYAAGAFLRPFIARSVIHASSQVRLRPAQNQWAPHVNRLVTHVVGALLHSAILPLFRRYAVAGRLSEAGYRSFLRDTLPMLSAAEEACAVAIFHRGGFPDIRPIMAALQPLVASAAPQLATVVSEATLGLTDFVEVMLMLSVVVYADEVRFATERPITAKLWCFFEDHVCRRALNGTPMCADPYITGRYAAVPPGLVSVHPTVAPLVQCPCLYLEVINVSRAGVAAHGRAPPAAAGAPSTEELASPSPFLTEVAVAGRAAEPPPPSSGGGDRGGGTGADVAVYAAATFFSTEWSLLERHRQVPLFGAGQADATRAVVIGGTPVDTLWTSCPEIVRVALPNSLQLPTLYRCAVEAVIAADEVCDGVVDAAYVQFIPFRFLPVELVLSDDEDEALSTDEDGAPTPQGRAWGCADIVVTDAAVEQVVTRRLLEPLHALFLTQTSPAVESGGSDSATPHRIPLAGVCELCRQLQWCAASAKQQHELPSLCALAWSAYCGFQRVLHPAAEQSQRGTGAARVSSVSTTETVEPRSGPPPPASLSFLEFIGCLATMLFQKQGGKLGDLPDVPRRLELALASVPTPLAGSTSTPVTAVEGSALGAKVRQIPHNAFRDVPFLNALERKRMQTAETQARRAALIASLRTYHAQQLTSPVALPTLPEDRPGAMRLVSQYGTMSAAEDFHAVMREGAEVVKAHFLQQELAIPEMSE
ncbi:hypothetical protein NESM_000524900 [Novymonas esmeraldas]|uniref:Uncharacterized protein n=1 Tax=Novymonas esmeraldas TaxID=1808958 RepID=A0AAW0ESF0_9TRYP